MSIDYTIQCLLASGRVDTPTDDDIAGIYWFHLHGGIIHALEVFVVTAGAQAASELVLEPYGGGTKIAGIVMGTKVAGTMLTERLDTADTKFAAGAAVQLRHETTDGSAVYEFRLWGVPGFI